MKKTIKIFVTLFYVAMCFKMQAQQINLSQEWRSSSGTLNFFVKSATYTDYEYTYIVGSTLNSNGNYDILVSKINNDGGVEWQNDYAGAANMDDGGIGIAVDDSNNVFITGYVVDDTAKEKDLVILKYRYDGLLVWATKFNNPTYNFDEIGTVISFDAQRNVYVGGSGKRLTTSSDFLITKFNINGNIYWSNYLNSNHNEGVHKLTIVGSTVNIVGPSQYDSISWVVISANFNASSGNYINQSTTGSSKAPFKEIRYITTSDSGYIFVTGKKNTANTDILTVKLNPNTLDTIWIKSFNGSSNQNDCGNSVAVDDSGYVYVTGYTTVSGSKDMVTLKYSPSGNLIWNQTFMGNTSGEDEGLDILVNAHGVVFVAGYIQNTTIDYAMLSYEKNGGIVWYRNYDGTGSDDRATNAAFDSSDNLIFTGQSKNKGSSTYQYTTIKYDYTYLPNNIVYTSDSTEIVDNELIISVKRSYLINDTLINDSLRTSGKAGDFLNNDVVEAIQTILNTDANVAEWKLIKIHPDAKTTDTIIITLLGDTLNMPFTIFNKFRLLVPEEFNIETVNDSLNKIDSIFHFVEYNFIYELGTAPNDPKYSTNQLGLYNTNPSYANLHINMEAGWDIETGSSEIGVGIFDSGIHFPHEDFTQNSSGVNVGIGHKGSMIIRGFDFTNNVDLTNDNTYTNNEHGSLMAGTVAGLRNNNRGIAGVAGGNIATNSLGCKLFSYQITENSNGRLINSAAAVTAINTITDLPSTSADKIAIFNHSWGGSGNSKNLKEAIFNAYRKGITQVAMSGNADNNNIAETEKVLFPGSFPDSWVIKVGGNGYPEGHIWESSVRDRSTQLPILLDIIAPADENILMAPSNQAAPLDYSVESGTSFSTAFVSGVSALLQSHHAIRHQKGLLAIEDIEAVLQLSATDYTSTYPPSAPLGITYTNGQDRFSGWGRMNAGAALNLIKWPENYVLQFDIPNGICTTNQIKTLELVEIIEDVDAKNSSGTVKSLSKAQYQANVHIITADHTPTLGPSITVVDCWQRNSSSRGLPHDPPNNPLLPNILDAKYDDYSDVNRNPTTHECIFSGSMQMHTFVYEFVNDVGGNPIPGGPYWVPCSLSEAKMAYSLLVEDNSANVGIKEVEGGAILYPNPTTGSVYLQLSQESLNETGEIELYSIEGKLVKTYGNTIFDNTNGVSLDLSALPSGVYICTIKTDEQKSITLKIVKL